MPRPLFSVIIPTHNRPAQIRRAIGSVTEQVCTDWELLVIDDGSIPSSETVVRTAARGYPLHYHYQANEGLGAARQRGAELARGAYLCYLDDDDWLLPEHLQVLADGINEHNSRIALYKTGIITVRDAHPPHKSTLFKSTESALLQHWTHPDSVLPYAIPREAALTEPSIQYYFSEDFNWLGRLMLRLPVVQLAAHTVIYRQHPANRTRAVVSKRVLTERQRAVRDLYQYGDTASKVPPSLYHAMLTHQCLHWVRQCLRTGNYGLAVWGIKHGGWYLNRYTLGEFGYTVLTAVRSLALSSG